MSKRAVVLPPEFDDEYYRRSNPDVAQFDEAARLAHFQHHGRGEGRTGSPVAMREGFLAEVVTQQKGPILEIGPFCRPLLSGPDVRYLDVLDAADLRARAIEIGLDPTDCPNEIHYLGDLADISERFNAVVSSHAIEHQPDLVHHLQSVGELLNAGGHYFLIIPDKRFCFDALIPESTIAQVLQAHREKRRVHTLQSVIEHRALTVHNDAARHWAGDHAPVAPDAQARRIGAAIAEHDSAAGAYIDVHAWYWTPANFRSAIFVLGLTRLRAVRVYNTPRDRFEFCVVLKKVVRKA